MILGCINVPLTNEQGVHSHTNLASSSPASKEAATFLRTDTETKRKKKKNILIFLLS